MRRLTHEAILFAAWATLVAALAGCPKNVPQHASSGKDYRHQGAKKVVLEQGEGRARDIVTYPGGDRVDWKVFEIPEGQTGDLQIKLTWRPPRPGGDVAFALYDQWFQRVGDTGPRSRSEGNTRRLKVKQASGKYYVQVYAPRRSDAGRYTLSVRFKERKPVALPSLDQLAGQIVDPPILPAVVEAKEKTPEELAAEEADRLRRDEERRLMDEERQAEQGRLAELRKPVYARIRQTQKSGDGGCIITVNVGKNMQIDKDWRGTLLRGNTKDPLPDGEFTIIRVNPRELVGKVQLPPDQVKAHPNVMLRRSGI